MNDFFAELFAQKPEEISYEHHPSDEVLREYLLGRSSREWLDPKSVLARLGSGREWGDQELSVHLLTCERCLRRAHALQALEKRTLRGSVRAWIVSVGERLRQVPRPALATIAVQSLVIVALVSVFFFRPAPVFRQSASSHTASQASSFLAGPAAQALYTLQQDSNPEKRLAAVQSLRQYDDPQLVESLSQALESEGHPQVRREIAQTLFSLWRRLASRLQHLSEKHRQEFDLFPVELGKLLRDLSLGRLEVRYPYEILCTARPALTLGELAQLASELDGMMTIDRFTSTGSFRLRLPLTLGGVQMLEKLESRLGVVCGR